jgi:zinc D-Ala-D-Ala dipeptidase
MKAKLIILMLVLISVFACNSTIKQTNNKNNGNPYHLDIVSELGVYDSIIALWPNKKQVDIEDYIQNIVLDIRYATTNNFTKEIIYAQAKAFVRLPVAIALQKVQKQLSTQGLGLKIFDAYRPYSATLRFYEVYPDTMFVAAPWHGSRHNRGCAVDVGLVDLKTGRAHLMPTKFDDFSEKASHGFMDLPEEKIKNREILRKAMEENGFTIYRPEWWHFDFQGWENYKLMDIPFDELVKRK